jgi:hypothetical protein
VTNTWVRAYHGSHTYFFVNTGDLYNFRVARNYPDTAWVIFADQKLSTGEVALLGAWDTEDEAGNALATLLRAVDLND